MNKKAIFKFLYIILIIAVCTFIFSNSVYSKEDSADTSGRIMNFLNNLLDFLHIPIKLNQHFVRKAAHFTEFFILGASLFGYTVFFGTPSINNSVYCCFLSCLVAMSDETIQYFTERGSMLLDVWLDFSSASLAIFLLYLFWNIKNKRRCN